jgi:uncharacterized SAM-binding protein YcdF (DUF218 family)
MRQSEKRKSNKNLRRISLRLAVSLSLFLLWLFLAPFLAKGLIVEKSIDKADAILVLSGSSTYLERTQKAAEVFKTGVAPKIFLTDDGSQGGWDKREQRNPFFAERARWELIKQGVPEDAIEILPGVVEGTQDEAVLTERTLRERNLRSILLVTSPYHTRRTLSTFETLLHKNAIETGIASPPTGEQSPSPNYWWLSVRGWRFVAGEYLKIAYYWLFY